MGKISRVLVGYKSIDIPLHRPQYSSNRLNRGRIPISLCNHSMAGRQVRTWAGPVWKLDQSILLFSDWEYGPKIINVMTMYLTCAWELCVQFSHSLPNTDYICYVLKPSVSPACSTLRLSSHLTLFQETVSLFLFYTQRRDQPSSHNSE